MTAARTSKFANAVFMAASALTAIGATQAFTQTNQPVNGQRQTQSKIVPIDVSKQPLSVADSLTTSQAKPFSLALYGDQDGTFLKEIMPMVEAMAARLPGISITVINGPARDGQKLPSMLLTTVMNREIKPFWVTNLVPGDARPEQYLKQMQDTLAAYKPELLPMIPKAQLGNVVQYDFRTPGGNNPQLAQQMADEISRRTGRIAVLVSNPEFDDAIANGSNVLHCFGKVAIIYADKNPAQNSDVDMVYCNKTGQKLTKSLPKQSVEDFRKEGVTGYYAERDKIIDAQAGKFEVSTTALPTKADLLPQTAKPAETMPTKPAPTPTPQPTPQPTPAPTPVDLAAVKKLPVSQLDFRTPGGNDAKGGRDKAIMEAQNTGKIAIMVSSNNLAGVNQPMDGDALYKAVVETVNISSHRKNVIVIRIDHGFTQQYASTIGMYGENEKGQGEANFQGLVAASLREDTSRFYAAIEKIEKRMGLTTKTAILQTPKSEDAAPVVQNLNTHLTP